MYKVLILEVDPNLAEEMRLYLEAQGLQITLCMDVQGLPSLLRPGFPDLLLIDLDGVESRFFVFYQWWQTHTSYRTLSRLMISSPQSNSLAQTLYNYGEHYILNKPLQPAAFLETIQGLLPQTLPSSSLTSTSPHSSFQGHQSSPLRASVFHPPQNAVSIHQGLQASAYHPAHPPMPPSQNYPPAHPPMPSTSQLYNPAHPPLPASPQAYPPAQPPLPSTSQLYNPSQLPLPATSLPGTGYPPPPPMASPPSPAKSSPFIPFSPINPSGASSTPPPPPPPPPPQAASAKIAIPQHTLPPLPPNVQPYRDLLQAWIGKQFGSFLIQSLIGCGGMGAVYKGLQASLQRQVAIKIMLPHAAQHPAALRRFEREALSMAQLHSPHVVQVFDAGVLPDQTLYIVMEYIDGEDLEKVIRKKGPFSPLDALRLVIQITKGLTIAHHSGLIHRDIKPSNLILDRTGRVVLTDFGLVRQLGETSDTQPGLVVGSPHYLSPEQIMAKSVDARTDIYATGIVFFELIAGRPPFVTHELAAMMQKHLYEPLPSLKPYNPNVPDALVTILQKMVEKNPDDRFASVSDVLDALEKVLMQQNPSYSSTEPSAAGPLLSRTHSSQDSASLVAVPSRPTSPPRSAGDENNVLSSDQIETIRLELARFIGPMADVLMKQEAKKMGFSLQRFPQKDTEAFLRKLAKRVDPAKHDKFLETALSLSSRFS